MLSLIFIYPLNLVLPVTNKLPIIFKSEFWTTAPLMVKLPPISQLPDISTLPFELTLNALLLIIKFCEISIVPATWTLPVSWYTINLSVLTTKFLLKSNCPAILVSPVV